MDDLEPTWRRLEVMAAVFTPMALRLEELRIDGKSFDEAFAIAESEYSSDGMSLKRGRTDLNAVLTGGLAQMGEVQF